MRVQTIKQTYRHIVIIDATPLCMDAFSNKSVNLFNIFVLSQMNTHQSTVQCSTNCLTLQAFGGLGPKLDEKRRDVGPGSRCVPSLAHVRAGIVFHDADKKAK
jgi:hypothetical protein